MEWLQSVAIDKISNGEEVITWTTPSGFTVTQDIRHSNLKRITTMIMGKSVMSSVGDGLLGPNLKGHQGAIAPNLVHSYDASLLHLTFCNWNKPFTVIHDCVLVRSCDVDKVMDDIRLHTAEIYKGNPLEDWAAEQGIDIPEGIMKGTLDPDDVLKLPIVTGKHSHE